MVDENMAAAMSVAAREEAVLSEGFEEAAKAAAAMV